MGKDKKIKIVTATGIPMLDQALAEKDEFDATNCVMKNELKTITEKINPDIVFISDRLSGEESTVKLLLELKRTYPSVRFIYLAGSVDMKDHARVDSLGMLVLVGIYDIIISQKINIDLIMETVQYPKTAASASFLVENLLDNDAEITNSFNGLQYEHYEKAEEVFTGYENVYVVTSIKPGTGKSFLSVNLACAIAKYGKDRPKVALIEADMQTLSIGTLLSINEKDGNLKNVINTVKELYVNDKLIEDEEKLKHANRIIKNNMVTYKNIQNLDVLVGSSLTPEEVDALNISATYFDYIINVLRKEYDYVIVDTNSSIFHVSSFVLLQKAYRCYYVLNLDFNNIRNNIRYQNVLKDLKIINKVKYVLNENIENTKEFYDLGVKDEELSFTAEDIEEKYFKLEAKIPVLPKTVFLNRLYEGTPVVLDSNSKTVTNRAKLEILKIANGICEINDELPKLQAIIDEQRLNKSGFFAKLFSKKKKNISKQTDVEKE